MHVPSIRSLGLPIKDAYCCISFCSARHLLLILLQSRITPPSICISSWSFALRSIAFESRRDESRTATAASTVDLRVQLSISTLVLHQSADWRAKLEFSCLQRSTTRLWRPAELWRSTKLRWTTRLWTRRLRVSTTTTSQALPHGPQRRSRSRSRSLRRRTPHARRREDRRTLG